MQLRRALLSAASIENESTSTGCHIAFSIMRQLHKSTATPSISKEHHFNARSALPQTYMQFPLSSPHTQTPFPSICDTESFTTELGSSPDKYALLIGEPVGCSAVRPPFGLP